MTDNPLHIFHIDMDAFFAAVEMLDNPGLRGKPVIVGAPPDRRGVVSAASYEARKYGVKSATPSRVAYRLCPHGIFLPVRMERYKDVSDQVMQVLYSFTPWVEPISVDEAFIDVSKLLAFERHPRQIARDIKDRIRTEINLTCSVGVATNKFLAKLGSDYDKPDGLTTVPADPEEARAFLAPLPVNKLWGVGPVTTTKLERIGIRSVADLQTYPADKLKSTIGEAAAFHLKEIATGTDNRPVQTQHVEKSISLETTFNEDVHDRDTLRRTLMDLVQRVGQRLRKSGKVGRTVQIKIRYAEFQTVTRQATLHPATASERLLLTWGLHLFERERITRPVRLLGAGVTDLHEENSRTDADLQQPLLFHDIENMCTHRQKADKELDKAVDRLRDYYGNNIIRRGIEVQKVASSREDAL